MNQKEIRELIEFLVEKDIAEFELERGDVKLHIKRSTAAHPAPIMQVAPAVPVQVMAVPAASSAPPPSTVAAESRAAAGTSAAAEAVDADLFIVKSPIVGTFYESPSPGRAAVCEGRRHRGRAGRCCASWKP